jgi:hypothetical protein
VLKPGARAVVHGSVAVTGPVTSEELAQRSSIGLFVFVPPEVNEGLITQAGFRHRQPARRHRERGGGLAPVARGAAEILRRPAAESRARNALRAFRNSSPPSTC